MKTQILSGIFFCFLGLLCLGHMGELVLLMPKAWFLMFVAASGAISYWTVGLYLICTAIKSRRDELAMQNKWRNKSSNLSRLLKRMRA